MLKGFLSLGLITAEGISYNDGDWQVVPYGHGNAPLVSDVEDPSFRSVERPSLFYHLGSEGFPYERETYNPYILSFTTHSSYALGLRVVLVPKDAP